MELIYKKCVTWNEELKRKLSDFGLDPLEWELSPIAKGLIQISNRSDSSFVLVGWLGTCGAKWERIELVSL